MSEPNTTLLQELRQLRDQLSESLHLLDDQQQQLRHYRLNPPPLLRRAAADLSTDFATLADGIIDEQAELGQLRALIDTAAMINSSLEVVTVLEQAMDIVIRLTGAERGYIVLRHPDTGELVYRVRRENASPLDPTQPPQVSQTIVDEVIETGQTLLTDNAYKDERLLAGGSVAQMGLRSVMCAPLLYRERVIGAVYVDNRIRAGAFSEHEKNLLSAFANQASVAIQNARLYERVQSSLAEIGEMKQLMENVFASIGSGVITTDAARAISTVNRAAASILAVQPHALIGEPLESALPDIAHEIGEQMTQVHEQDISHFMETELDVAGRGRMALNIKLSPLKDAHGHTQGAVILLDDVTEEREREARLNVIQRYLPPEMVENIHAISRLALGGERREVTCMFIDVRSPETFPAELRPRQIMEALNVYLAQATTCIYQEQGIIDKYIGNEIMVLFNTQLNPLADHPWRAVRVAQAIRQAFSEPPSQPRYFRIGIHSGVATLGNVGSVSRREFTAIGDTINLAKRVQENAAPGQIMLTRATYETMAHSGDATTANLRPCAAVQLKGRQQATELYEVI
ncbi:MAG: GAF domain-containing protein [Phototrophicaceae bacterium]